MWHEEYLAPWQSGDVTERVITSGAPETFPVDITRTTYECFSVYGSEVLISREVINNHDCLRHDWLLFGLRTEAGKLANRGKFVSIGANWTSKQMQWTENREYQRSAEYQESELGNDASFSMYRESVLYRRKPSSGMCPSCYAVRSCTVHTIFALWRSTLSRLGNRVVVACRASYPGVPETFPHLLCSIVTLLFEEGLTLSFCG